MKLKGLTIGLPVPDCVTECRNVHCVDHDNAINEYCETILDAIELSAKDQLPSTGKKTKRESVQKRNLILDNPTWYGTKGDWSGKETVPLNKFRATSE